MNSDNFENKCPLCLSYDSRLLFVSTRKKLERIYFTCSFCGLVFVPSIYHLSLEEQRSRYLEHNNSPTDIGYREFLSKLKDELIPYLKPGQFGLDYGAGPGPTLSAMLESDGFKMEVFDPIFDNKLENLERSYDFIVCTETAEHFLNPNKDFQILHDLVRPGGLIGIMTSILYDEIKFEDWYYRLDPTHISFYRPLTMKYVADRWNLRYSSPAENVCLFKKPIG